MTMITYFSEAVPLGPFYDLRTIFTLGPEFHMYTCMHAFATLTASHHMVKVHNVTALY